MKTIFEWDENKAQTNLEKHKVSFEEARTIFSDPLLLTFVDELHSDKEERLISIGLSGNNRVLLAVHTEREEQKKWLLFVSSVAGRQQTPKENAMKKKTIKPQDNDMLPEYDLTGKKGVRGKYANSLKKGYSVRVLKADGTVETRAFVPKDDVVLLDPDVRVYFPDSESVNRALRSLIDLIPEKKVGHVAERRGRYIAK